jgi:hypothetical protein
MGSRFDILASRLSSFLAAFNLQFIDTAFLSERCGIMDGFAERYYDF